LATSFLLLGEDVIAYNKGTLTSLLLHHWYFSEQWKDEFTNIRNIGEEIKLKPYSGVLNIDFGKGVRKRDVYLL
jgi:hypothetical protein